MTPCPVSLTDHGSIRRITVDRPDKLNALNAATLDALDAAFAEAASDAARPARSKTSLLAVADSTMRMARGCCRPIASSAAHAGSSTVSIAQITASMPSFPPCAGCARRGPAANTAA